MSDNKTVVVIGALDVMTSTTKVRQHGFHDVVDSEDMFVRLLRQFRTERIVP